MSDQQVGATFRVVRIRSGKRQEDVATGAGVPRSRVSSVERGHLDDVPIDQLRAIATYLEIRVEIVVSWRGGDGARIVNERHSRMHELMAGRLAAIPGWEFATEVTFSRWGERGTIDILAWHAHTRTLLIIELKTEIPDPAGVVAQVDRYERLAPWIGRARGWDPLRVATWVLVAESDLNRRQVARHRVMLRNAFPLNGQFLRRWLRDPSAGSTRPAGGAGAGGSRVPGRRGVRGLSFIANAAGGSTNGRLGPTKRVRPRRPSPEGPDSIVSDAPGTHKRMNRAAAGAPSGVEVPRAAGDLG
ncbi:MAG TPA: helix-turn-helix transcriptional regulator [Patescibacteria group bacterium]|nr:helix-turn-helix transcriptional regulator [Patescibacteria group bacterium]